MSARTFLGLDGGGTKTEAVLIDGCGHEIARAAGGPSNYHSVGQETAQASLQAAMRHVLNRAALTWDAVDAIGLGMAGVARPRDYQVVRELLARIAPPLYLAIANDAEAALVGGTGHRYGAVLIAGTGAIAYGVNARGESQRADGWGYLLGDEGSGYWIGRQALRATARACDGRGPGTKLQGRVFDALELCACDELVSRVYASGLSVPEIAALAPSVQSAAEQGDAVARDILCRAGERLGHTLCTVIRKLDMGDQAFQVMLLGGVLSAEGLVRETVVTALQASAPNATVIRPQHDAAFGAAILARDLWLSQQGEKND